MAMNSQQDASPDLPEAEAPDVDTDADSESLQRSRDAIDQGHEAAREALPDEADGTAGPTEEPPSGEEHASAPSEGESER
jgi:cellobiose-specific phosphotransferase system component IIA